ncbi:hypothetical protein ACFFX0_00075 [Citricoccus parietis]|uniref:Uncharacterized protein n=1 Tax=Citricoccus parietis TaxID=592307 RepID=A0ABV5FSP7_9MICC
MRQDPSQGGGPLQVLWIPGDLLRGGSGDRSRFARGHPRIQRRGQDHPAADARRGGPAGP